MTRLYHTHSFWDAFLLTIALETGNTCHDTIDSLAYHNRRWRPWLVSLLIALSTRFHSKCRFHLMASTFPTRIRRMSDLHKNQPSEFVKHETSFLTTPTQFLLHQKQIGIMTLYRFPMGSWIVIGTGIGGSTPPFMYPKVGEAIIGIHPPPRSAESDQIRKNCLLVLWRPCTYEY
jgi:hypothetical protein